MSILRQSRLWPLLCFAAIFLATGAGPLAACACAGAPAPQVARHSQPRRAPQKAPCCALCVQAQRKTGQHPCSASAKASPVETPTNTTRVQSHSGPSYGSPCFCQADDLQNFVAASLSPHTAPDTWATLPIQAAQVALPPLAKREFVARGHDPPRQLAPSIRGSRAPPSL